MQPPRVLPPPHCCCCCILTPNFTYMPLSTRFFRIAGSLPPSTKFFRTTGQDQPRESRRRRRHRRCVAEQPRREECCALKFIEHLCDVITHVHYISKVWLYINRRPYRSLGSLVSLWGRYPRVGGFSRGSILLLVVGLPCAFICTSLEAKGHWWLET